MSERKTYRHRNGGGHWISSDAIHTFWVNQRVIRSYERRNYVDKIEEEGVVVSIPTNREENLVVKVEDGSEHQWTVGEATPYRVWAEKNAKRLRDAAKAFSEHLKTVDDNGHKIEKADA